MKLVNLHRIWLLSVLLIAFSSSAKDIPNYVSSQLEVPVVAGEGRLDFLFWDVYDAVLFTPATGFSESSPFALSLTYLMDFKGKDIASRSIKEMQSQGWKDVEQLSTWQLLMNETFPDVVEGDTLVGIYTNEQATRFYHNGEFIRQIDDATFGQAFFGIWLSESTSEPKLRRKLLGE